MTRLEDLYTPPISNQPNVECSDDNNKYKPNHEQEYKILPYLEQKFSTNSVLSKSSIEQQSTLLDFVPVLASTSTSIKKKECCGFSVRKRMLVYLILLGAISGLIGLGIKEAILALDRAHHEIAAIPETEIFSFLLWTSFSLLLVLFAVVWTDKIQPVAAGSGLPEIKTILSGSEIKDYLTIQTFFAKVFGLIAAAGSGLSIGSEGPFVHITCILADHVLHWNTFKEFQKGNGYRLQLIAAAAAVGVSANFSAPLGGVLFSIEVTSTYYLLDNYWKSVLSSISAAAFSSLLQIAFKGKESFSKLFQNKKYPLSSYEAIEYPFFLLIGIIMGISGAFLVRLFAIFRRYRSSATKSHLHQAFKKYIVPILVSILTSTLTFWPGSFMRGNLSSCLDLFVSHQDLPYEWTQHYSIYLSLLIFAIIYYFLTPMSISLAIPAGAFLPSFVTGAAFGRIFGLVLRNYILMDNSIHPGVYALAGGAALATGVTRTISSAVIALELTGQYHLILPVFIAVLAAYGAGSLISDGLFITILNIRGLAYLPILQYEKQYRVKDVMEKHVLKLPRQTTYTQILIVVNMMERRTIPIVENNENLLLLGALTRKILIHMLSKYYELYQLDNLQQDLGNPDESIVQNTSDSLIDRSIALLRNAFDKTIKQSLPPSSFYHPLNTSQSNMMNQWGTNVSSNYQKGALQDDFLLQALLAQYWSPLKKNLMNTTIDLLEHLGMHVLQPTVLTVPDNALLEDVHIIFTMMRCQKLYVTHHGKLSGEITPQHLIKHGKKH